MKIAFQIPFFLSVVTLVLQSSICERLVKLEKTSKLNYHEEILDGFIVDKSVSPLNDNEFFDIYKRQKASSEKCYLVSKFSINKNRIGVVSFNSGNEGDKIIDYYNLHVIENCKVIKTYCIMISDGDTMFYNISSKLKKDFSTLTITEETSSEENQNGKIDTLYTKIWKIDLKSAELDTISKKSFFKILPSPPQK
jgi:hypothetical protein